MKIKSIIFSLLVISALAITSLPGGSPPVMATVAVTESPQYGVTFNSKPTADFSGSPTIGCAPLTVNFTDLSTGDPTSWSWTFGDGGSSSDQNPLHQYTSAGCYDVSLTVSNDGGDDTETKKKYVTVHDIDFVSHTWDGTYSTWTYEVNSGCHPAISHWVIAWCDCDAVHEVSESSECKYDEIIGETGIKFDVGYYDGESRTVWFKLEGNWPEGVVPIGTVAF